MRRPRLSEDRPLAKCNRFNHSNQLHYRCSPTAKPDCSPGSDVRNPGRNTSVVYFNLICVTGLIIE